MNKEILCKCLLECKDEILVFTNFTSLVLISTMIALLVILFIKKESSLHMFKIKDEDGLITVIANYPKAGHKQRGEVNHEYVEIELKVMKYVNYNLAALLLIPRERYRSFYYNELYFNMTWLDPQYWQEGPSNGKDKILQLFHYFEVPLSAANSDKILTKILLKSLFGENDTMEGSLLIARNNSSWSEQEKEEILNKAVEKYLQKKQKTKIVDATKESVLASINQKTMIPHLFLPPAMNILIWKFIANEVLFFNSSLLG